MEFDACYSEEDLWGVCGQLDVDIMLLNFGGDAQASRWFSVREAGIGVPDVWSSQGS